MAHRVARTVATDIFLTALIAMAPQSAAKSCDLTADRRHNAIRMIDARTIELDDNSAIRLAAILPPTRYDSPAAPTPFAPETNARSALAAEITSRILAIATERDTPDRYQRTIAHAFLNAPHPPKPSQVSAPAVATKTTPPLEDWLQARLVRAGHARVALTPELSRPCARHLLTLEADAENNRRGLWREALYQAKSANDPRALLKLRSTFQIVIGRVHEVAFQKSTVYLNFAEDWQRDFTVRISKRVLKHAKVAPERLQQLTGRPIRVRGWIERRGGPLINIWRLEQIEIIEQAPTGRLERPDTLILANDLATDIALPAPTRLPAVNQAPRITPARDRNEKAPAPQ